MNEFGDKGMTIVSPKGDQINGLHVDNVRKRIKKDGPIETYIYYLTKAGKQCTYGSEKYLDVYAQKECLYKAAKRNDPDLLNYYVEKILKNISLEGQKDFYYYAIGAAAAGLHLDLMNEYIKKLIALGGNKNRVLESELIGAASTRKIDFIR